MPDISVKDADNTVKLGISRVQKLLSFKRLILSRKQTMLINEMGLYQYDEKSIEKGKEEVLKINDHCEDGTRYAVMGMWKKIKYFLPVGVREDRGGEEQ